MKAIPFCRILGAFRILRRRVGEVGQPALAMWADAGETAATQVREGISGAAHAGETTDLEAAKEIDAGLAGLTDGRADSADLAHFQRAARLVRRSAELDHDISEAVRS